MNRESILGGKRPRSGTGSVPEKSSSTSSSVLATWSSRFDVLKRRQWQDEKALLRQQSRTIRCINDSIDEADALAETIDLSVTHSANSAASAAASSHDATTSTLSSTMSSSSLPTHQSTIVRLNVGGMVYHASWQMLVHPRRPVSAAAASSYSHRAAVTGGAVDATNFFTALKHFVDLEQCAPHRFGGGGGVRVARDASGAILIDRCGATFRHVLNYCRGYVTLPCFTAHEALMLMSDADFYGYPEIKDMIPWEFLAGHGLPMTLALARQLAEQEINDEGVPVEGEGGPGQTGGSSSSSLAPGRYVPAIMKAHPKDTIEIQNDDDDEEASGAAAAVTTQHSSSVLCSSDEEGARSNGCGYASASRRPLSVHVAHCPNSGFGASSRLMRFQPGPGISADGSRFRTVYVASPIGDTFMVAGRHTITFEVLAADYVGIGIMSDSWFHTDLEFHRIANCVVYYMTGVFYSNCLTHKKEDNLAKFGVRDFVTVLVDMDEKTIEFFINGKSEKMMSIASCQRARFGVAMKLESAVRIVDQGIDAGVEAAEKRRVEPPPASENLDDTD